MAPWQPSKGGLLSNMKKARPSFPGLAWGYQRSAVREKDVKSSYAMEQFDGVATVKSPRHKGKSKSCSPSMGHGDLHSLCASGHDTSPQCHRRRRQPCTSPRVHSKSRSKLISSNRCKAIAHIGKKNLVMPVLAEECEYDEGKAEMVTGKARGNVHQNDCQTSPQRRHQPKRSTCSTESPQKSQTPVACSLAQSCWRSNLKNRKEALDFNDDSFVFQFVELVPPQHGMLDGRRSSVHDCRENSISSFGSVGQSDRAPAMDPMVAIKLGASYNLKPSEVTQARRTFEKYDFDGRGTLDRDEFNKLIDDLIHEHVPETKELPQDLFKGVDDSGDGEVDFEEFLQWLSTQSFREEVLVPMKEQNIRRIARKFNLPVPEVEAVKHRFDRFDSNRSGTIDFDEFSQLLRELLKTPQNAELPRNRVTGFWREIDSDASGVVDFEEFLPWFVSYFPIDGRVQASPVESFYANIRGNVHSSGAVQGRHCMITNTFK